MQRLIDLLHSTQCSLVVLNHGVVSTYNKKGVRDLMALLDSDSMLLHGACIADKVVGKAAAAIAIVGGVVEVYGEVMSRSALPLLNQAGVRFSYGELVDAITIADGDNRCRLEEIVAESPTANEVVEALRSHFAEMARRRAHSD